MEFLSVYILKCSDNSLYTGVTNDLDRRIAEHQDGSNITAYTYKRRPVELLWHKELRNTDAIAFEKQIKGWTRAKKMALINEDFDLLVELAKRKNT